MTPELVVCSFCGLSVVPEEDAAVLVVSPTSDRQESQSQRRFHGPVVRSNVPWTETPGSTSKPTRAAKMGDLGPPPVAGPATKQ